MRASSLISASSMLYTGGRVPRSDENKRKEDKGESHQSTANVGAENFSQFIVVVDGTPDTKNVEEGVFMKKVP